jgi:diphthamide biosynthesis protein 4
MESSQAGHYMVLGLPEPRPNLPFLTASHLKTAYRASLLRHHPDKAAKVSSSRMTADINDGFSRPTVDQITEAYAVLSNPKLKAEYDRERLLNTVKPSTNGPGKDHFRTGIDIVDLDDLDFDTENQVWYRSCRCGNARGFAIKEQELEQAAEEGEIGLGCEGCSLWIKVMFEVVDGPDREAVLDDKVAN